MFQLCFNYSEKTYLHEPDFKNYGHHVYLPDLENKALAAPQPLRMIRRKNIEYAFEFPGTSVLGSIAAVYV